MRISLLCSDSRHPVNKYLNEWMGSQGETHNIELVRHKSELSGGDILLLISCTEIIEAKTRAAYKAALILHASDLPQGRGWSPHIWELVEGAESITISLLEAEDKVDSGRIWKKLNLAVPRHALWNEINDLLFQAEIELIDFAVREFETIKPIDQDPTIEPTYYPRRSPLDSQIDPWKSIACQFDKIRVCDPDRFPAFFTMHGKTYKLILEKLDE